MSKDRLSKALAELKYKNVIRNQTEFGDKMGYNKTYVSRLFNGHEPISYQIAKEMETVFQLNSNWLLTGHGEMFVKGNTDEKKDGNNNTDNSNIALSLDDNSILNTQNDTLMMNNLRQLMLSHQQNTETARLAAKAALLALENESELIKMIKQYLPKNVMA